MSLKPSSKQLTAGLVLLAFALASCQPAATPPPATNTEAPTQAPPTATEEPTLTPTATLEPTPEGRIFRDDFTEAIDPSWIIDNEVADQWEITNAGTLRIQGDDPSLLIHGEQTNLFWQAIPSGDFEISTFVHADASSDFQQAAIFIYQDDNNYVTINRGYCSPCAAGGPGIYMDYKLAGSFGNQNIRVDTNDVYLKLVSQGGQIVGYYALTPNDWERLGRVGNYLQAGYVGLGVTNSDSGNNFGDDLLGAFDYFEIAVPQE
jgi:hypothetical protein